MTFRELYEFGQNQLQLADIEDADYDAWYLLEFITGMSRAVYFLRMHEEVSADAEKRYREVVQIRQKRIPLQHITGTQEFMGLTFAVNEHVLIPRQDTEVLVESVLGILRPGMRVLDMCTGSGCILISLLKGEGNACGVGADISENALHIAKLNAKTHDVDATFVQGNLFENVTGTYDVIVSNPPYICTAVIEELEDEVRLHDPFIALDGKEDGLYFYRKIVDESPKYLKPCGKLYFEIGHDQGDAVKSLMEEKGFSNVTVKKDLAGLDRVVFGVYNY